MPAPLGNRNNLKHGLYAKRLVTTTHGENLPALRDPVEIIRTLEKAIEHTFTRFELAQDDDTLAKLGITLAKLATSYFNGQRALAFVQGRVTVIDEVLVQFESLDPYED